MFGFQDLPLYIIGRRNKGHLNGVPDYAYQIKKGAIMKTVSMWPEPKYEKAAVNIQNFVKKYLPKWDAVETIRLIIFYAELQGLERLLALGSFVKICEDDVRAVEILYKDLESMSVPGFIPASFTWYKGYCADGPKS